jgi:hypothetical protein
VRWLGKDVAFDKLLLVFTADADWQRSVICVKAVGIDDIVAMLRTATGGESFAMHSFTKPVIDVDAQAGTATGNWLLWVSVADDGKPNEVHQSEELTSARLGPLDDLLAS